MSAATANTGHGEPQARGRDWFLSAMAVLFLILAFSDFTKTLQHARNPGLGLVLLGHRLTSIPANIIGGSLFGLFLAAYAYGLWNARRWVAALAIPYAFWVPVNEVLFWFLHTDQRPTVGFIAFYLFVSLGGSIGTALYIAWNRARLS